MTFAIAHGEVIAIVLVAAIGLGAAAFVRLRRPLQLAWFAALAIGFALLGLALLYAIGRHLVASDPRIEGPRTRTSLGAIAIAAALPGTREEALARIENVVAEAMPRTRDVVELGVAIARLRRGCDGEVEALTHIARFDEAAAIAHDCNDDAAVPALIAAGRYVEALRLATDRVDVFDRGVAAIGAGAWDQAARIASSAAKLKDIGDTSRTLECFAQLMRSYGGAADAMNELRVLVTQAGFPARCNAMLSGDLREETPVRAPAALLSDSPTGCAAMSAATDLTDGDALASLIEGCDTYSAGASLLLLHVVPKLTRSRDRVAEALANRPWLGYSPLRGFEEATLRRDLARAVGDSQASASWQAIVDRQTAVNADRSRHIGLRLWGELEGTLRRVHLPEGRSR